MAMAQESAALLPETPPVAMPMGDGPAALPLAESAAGPNSRLTLWSTH